LPLSKALGLLEYLAFIIIKGFKMIKLLFICFTFCTLNAFADEAYDSGTSKDIHSIYWLNKKQDGAIVYAKHHGFIELRNFIDTAILTSHQLKNSKFNTETAEQLLLMLPASKKWLVVYFNEDKISYNGQTYLVDSNTIKEMTQMNIYRINKGDLISSQLLNKAKKLFGSS
jgi:hypothetical protein